MGKPSRQDFNVHGIKGKDSQVAWNCTKCGTQGTASNRAQAGKGFDKHDCKDN